MPHSPKQRLAASGIAHMPRTDIGVKVNHDLPRHLDGSHDPTARGVGNGSSRLVPSPWKMRASHLIASLNAAMIGLPLRNMSLMDPARPFGCTDKPSGISYGRPYPTRDRYLASGLTRVNRHRHLSSSASHLAWLDIIHGPRLQLCYTTYVLLQYIS